jgi:hypothetical protein
MTAPSSNAWRALAHSLGVPDTTDVVKIPDFSSVLLDEARYAADRDPFQKWYAQYLPHRSGDPRDAYPEWRFNSQVEPDGKSGFSLAGRNSFLCVYAKLKHEGIWPHIKTVRWVGETGEITFFADRTSAEMQQLLLGRGYGDWWMAGKDTPWGVRSRFRGAQLHFRGYNSTTEPDNVHIDLHNPGDPPTGQQTGVLEELPGALQHYFEDLHNRRQSHTWDQLRQGLIEQGVPLLPIVP